MVRKWTVGATGFALLATTLVVVACSSKSDDDDDNGGGAKGGTSTAGGKGGTGGGTMGGTGGMGTGGGTMGGTTSTGGMGGTTTTGGMAGTPAQGGAAGNAAGSAGAAAMGPYECKGSKATCDTYSDFGTGDAAWWGSGDFNGGFSVFKPTGKTLDRDTTDMTKIHITGTVDNYGFGFNFWFTFCSDLSAYTGVQFTLTGTTMAATPLMANTIDFQPQTNSDYPWQPRPMDNKGGCTSPTPDNPWSDCIAPAKRMTTMDGPQMVLWSDTGLANGTPVKFDATMSPKEIVGLQFQFPWDSTATAYAVDVTLDDVSFIGGTGISCGTMVGSGGMGGMGGMAGGAGTAGASAGTAGTSGGMAGTAGASGGQGGNSGGQGGNNGGQGGNSGGMSGGAGRGGAGAGN